MNTTDRIAEYKRIATREATDTWIVWATRAAFDMATAEAAWNTETRYEALEAAGAAWRAAEGNDAAWDAAVAAAAVVYDTAAKAVKT